MSRRRLVKVREVLPDVRYGNTVVSKFINCLMMQGKRALAEKIFYQALRYAFEQDNTEEADELAYFLSALSNVEPDVEVCSQRYGGATYQVPVEVRPKRKKALAIRWLIWAARKRSEKTMIHRLGNELIDAKNSKGDAFKKKVEMHKVAEANRAFSHYSFRQNSQQQAQ